MTVTLLVKQISLDESPVPHRRIKSFHGKSGQMRWRHNHAQVIDHITRQLFHYYILKNGRPVRIVIDRLADGEPFLKAESDGHFPEMLFQLPVISPDASKEKS